MTHDLIIQGDAIGSSDVDALRVASGAAGATRIEAAHEAWRLHGAAMTRRAEVKTHCATRHIDFAFVPSERRWRDIGLIAMDMDSTLITIECIDEIADFVGKKREVADVTERAMRGEIDWPQSLRQRVALLAGLDEGALAEVYEQRLKLTPGAEDLITFAKSHGIKLLLVSGGFTCFTERLKTRLGLDYAFSNTLEIIGGKLTGHVIGDLCDAQAKARHLTETREALGLAAYQTIAIGDGANDLPMMAVAGFSIAFHAKPKVQAEAASAINFGGLERVIPLFAA
jgi:phosphoserine phosphatase